MLYSFDLTCYLLSIPLYWFGIFYENNHQTKLPCKLFLNIGLHVSVYTDHSQVLKSSNVRYITCVIPLHNWRMLYNTQLSSWVPEDGQYRPKHVVLYLRISCMIIVVFDGHFHKIYVIFHSRFNKYSLLKSGRK